MDVSNPQVSSWICDKPTILGSIDTPNRKFGVFSDTFFDLRIFFRSIFRVSNDNGQLKVAF